MRSTAFRLWVACYLLCGACGCGHDGEVTVSVRHYELVTIDTSRRTSPNGTFPGAAERTIRFLVWTTNTAAGRSSDRPLLILAHGFGGLPEKFAALARTVAAKGISVVAPAFPLTNQNAPGGHETALRDVRNQPADVSFLLDTVLSARDTVGHPLYRGFDSQKVAVLGHSLGAVTLLGLTRKLCCIDPRIRAAIFVAPPPLLANVFGVDAPQPLRIPALVIHGDSDPVVPIQAGRDLYHLWNTPKFFLGIKGAGHSDLVESQLEPPIAARAVTQDAITRFLGSVFFGTHNAFTEWLGALRSQGHEAILE